MPGPIKVLIADDHPIVRQGLAAVVGQEPDMEVVGQASNGAEAVAEAGILRPDVVLMDLRMPEMDGVQAILKIKEDAPDIGIIILTTFSSPDTANVALKNFFGPDKPYVQGQQDIYAKLLESWGGVPDHLRWMFKDQGDVELDDKHSGDSYVEGYGGETIARAVWNEVDADTMCDRGIVVGGNPESCIRALKLHEEAGCDQLMIMFQTETVPHEKVMKSYELFGKYVIPEFKKSEQKAKAVGP